MKRTMLSLDDGLSQEYREAMRFAPRLVEKECRIIDFLRTDDYHTQKAACRVANYWKLRKDTYQERWLHPMEQTSRGVLPPEAVEVLHTGFLAVTKGLTPDGVVFIADYSRLSTGVSLRKYCASIIFYLICVSTNELLQTQGFTILHVVRAIPGRGELTAFLTESLERVLTSLPVRIKNTVVTRTFDPTQDDVLDHVAFLYQRRYRQCLGTAEYLHGGTVRNTLGLLEERAGLDRSSIPLVLGGDYMYHIHFQKWLRNRLSIEGSVTVASSVRNGPIVEEYSPVGPASNTPYEEKQSNNGNERSLVKRKPGESKEAFTKRRYQVYGRRSYNKKKRQLDVTKEMREHLRKSNAALRSEQRRLEFLLAEAQQITGAHRQRFGNSAES